MVRCGKHMYGLSATVSWNAKPVKGPEEYPGPSGGFIESVLNVSVSPQFNQHVLDQVWLIVLLVGQ